MLYIKHEGKDVPKTGEPTYTIMPGYFIPCAIETAMNSDTGDITFVAIVTSTVYDTETGHHPLILQSSKIVGEGQGSQLLYGNERLRTVSLTLSRRHDKAPIALGEAPVTDQAGMNGLVSRVDQHFWRLVGAVFIGGALKGGTQAVQTAIAGTGPAGQVGGGIAQTGQQAITQRTGPALNTRPTIEVDAGQLCNVMVTKPLHLTQAR
jgi:type IV secretory pathway VirB10-like protein